MKKKNWWKAALLALIIIACISIPLILYFTIGQKDSGGSPSKVNLDEQHISYLADVQYMNSITEEEATIIRNDIQTNINDKLNNLNLEKNIDYQINNVDMIQNGTDLNDVLNKINASSLPSSTKATGTSILQLEVREDISNRSIPTITVPTSEAESLSALTASNILRNITIPVQNILNEGQNNDEGVDYEIVNLNLIAVGAKFSDYNTVISVQPISTSTHLKGTFKINFQLQ